MKAEHISIAIALEQIPNVGRKTARLLGDIGIHRPADLTGKNSYFLYDKICQITRQTQDPRLLDILLSVEDFTQGNSPRHWSDFSEQRKKLLTDRKKG